MACPPSAPRSQAVLASVELRAHLLESLVSVRQWCPRWPGWDTGLSSQPQPRAGDLARVQASEKPTKRKGSAQNKGAFLSTARGLTFLRGGWGTQGGKASNRQPSITVAPKAWGMAPRKNRGPSHWASLPGDECGQRQWWVVAFRGKLRQGFLPRPALGSPPVAPRQSAV